jgi:hypothetical protein
MSRWIYIDLRGGSDWLLRSVKVKVQPADGMSDEELRRLAAHYYRVPLAQIGPVSRRYPPPKPRVASAPLGETRNTTDDPR